MLIPFSFGICAVEIVGYLAENQIRLVLTSVWLRFSIESRIGVVCVCCTYFNYPFFISLQLLRRLPTILGRDRFLSWLANSTYLALNYYIIMFAFSPCRPTCFVHFPSVRLQIYRETLCTSFSIFFH